MIRKKLAFFAEEALKRWQRYYVRTDVKTNITELLQKITQYLEHLSDFLPTNSTNSLSTFRFCCQSCKKQIEKQEVSR